MPSHHLFVAATLLTTLPAQLTLTTQRVATGLSRPVGVASPIGDYDRLFILEQTGRIKILRNGAVLPTPYLDIVPLVNTSSGSSDRGLLGFAFHPDYRHNGHVFVCYTRISDGASMVVRYTVSTNNPDIVDLGTATTILGPISQPYANNNGGCLQFGPDGYLYVGLGDGGSAGDPGCRAQNNSQLLGKILRLDVDHLPNIIPPTNPFVGQPGLRGEIFHYGLHNPWRFSFDRLTGDMYLGDPGESMWEEIDFHAAGQPGGVNFGWRILEAWTCFGSCSSAPPCASALLQRPIHQYPGGGAVIGGYVYRGCAIPSLRGTYFFADYITATITSSTRSHNVLVNVTDRTAELNVAGQAMTLITSFGEDACGELYLCTLNGHVHKIVPRSGAPMTNLGFGELASNAIIPRLAFCGPFAPTTELILENAPGVTPAALLLGSNNNPTPVPDIGLVVPYPPDLITGVVVTNASGRYSTPLPTVGSWVVHCQWVLLDAANPSPFVLSNAVRLVMP